MKRSQPKNFNRSHKRSAVSIPPATFSLLNVHLGRGVGPVWELPALGSLPVAWEAGLRHPSVTWSWTGPQVASADRPCPRERKDLVPGSVPAATPSLHSNPVPRDNYYPCYRRGN